MAAAQRTWRRLKPFALPSQNAHYLLKDIRFRCDRDHSAVVTEMLQYLEGNWEVWQAVGKGAIRETTSYSVAREAGPCTRSSNVNGRIEE
jgi:hypothetical protein